MSKALLKRLESAKRKDLPVIQAEIACHFKLFPRCEPGSKGEKLMLKLERRVKGYKWVAKDSMVVLKGKEGTKFLPDPYLTSLDHAFALGQQILGKDISLTYKHKQGMWEATVSEPFKHKSAPMAVAMAIMAAT